MYCADSPGNVFHDRIYTLPLSSSPISLSGAHLLTTREVSPTPSVMTQAISVIRGHRKEKTTQATASYRSTTARIEQDSSSLKNLNVHDL